MSKQKLSHTKIDNTEAFAELDTLSERLGKRVARDVSDVVGVICDIKPAAIIGGDNTYISKDFLKTIGLESTDSSVKDILYVSKDMKVARRLARLHEKSWEDPMESLEEHREIGELLGYPDSAIDYYLKRLKTLDSDNPLPQCRPPEVEGTVSRRFQRFILSPDNYELEVRGYCIPLEEATRLYAPKTYAAICALSSRS